MKYAEATYNGLMRMNTYRVPDTGEYAGQTFTRGVSEPIESLEAAEWLDDHSEFRLEWTVRGRAVRALTGDQYETPDEMLSAWGYRAKQQLAKSCGIKANQSEEELEAELEAEVKELQSQMERL